MKMPSCPECSKSINIFKVESNGDFRCSNCGAHLKGKDYRRNNMIAGLIFFVIFTPIITALLWGSIWIWPIDFLAGFLLYWFIVSKVDFERKK